MRTSFVPRSIALWGPEGSGKTWLINAFCKALTRIETGDCRFSYELFEVTGKDFASPVLMFEPSALPTEEHTVHAWKFRRRPLRKDLLADQVSTHLHDLLVHDMRGAETILLAEEAREVFLSADLILVLLDPTLISGVSASKENQSLGRRLSQLEYAGYVQQLFDFVLRSSLPRPEIAVCITKLDTLVEPITKENLLVEQFGNQMLFVINEFQRKFKTEIFGTSSAGYVNESIQTPNYDPIQGKLSDTSCWEPRFVEKPFFWFLENIERGKLLQSTSLLDGLFSKINLSEYISYPNLE